MRPADIAETHTPEDHWQAWLDAGEPWPELPLTVDRLVVVGAHPDDEVLGVGGVMSAATAAGIDVTTVCMSDGRASHPGSPTWTPDQLAARRHVELDTATDLLGVTRPRWAGLPDGTLAGHESAMGDIIDAVLDEQPGVSTVLLSVWEFDGHPDHDAVGRCARAVAERRGLPLWQYPIWMWHRARPGDPAVPWERMHAHRLDATVLAVKHAAVHAFGTQVRPLSADPADAAILPPEVLAHLTRHKEYVLT